ncbi:scavenger receptor cysteine-rich domain-containing protein DMBT1-like isoform X2 [Garra rufa]|uniref:scavenger receptor cysteine-rich domain-containing protein DMBT1-like isoform X2 n=1 Tax=Garra rufa TaxID=137080 RepID=UPI003CCE5C0B
MFSCACDNSCHNFGDCCPDYDDYCAVSTTDFGVTSTEEPSYSCRYNCGYDFGTCSCTHSCQYYGNCCYDYDSYCSMTTNWPDTTALPSCRYNCGYNLGSCSCNYDCQYYGSCCPDYDSYCSTTTDWPHTTDFPSCMYNCGYYIGSCSCTHDCQYYGNCCPDYSSYCPTPGPTATSPEQTSVETDTSASSCMYNCGYYAGSCSCTSYCHHYGDCCPDYDSYCPTPAPPTTFETATTGWMDFTAEPCGGYMTDWIGDLFSPRYPNNYPNNARCTWTIHSTGNTTVSMIFTDVDLETCCDYIRIYDGPSIHYPLLGEIRDYRNQSFKSSNNDLTVFFFSDHSVTRKGFHAEWISVALPSCMNNCGYNLSNCSCNYNCQYYGNCCPDYNSYCSSTTETPATAETTADHSCMYNCGYHFGSCSCDYDCQYYGNCCYDFHWYCPSYTTPDPHPHCGGHLYGSGLFSSPNYPYYYHDNAYCVWYLSAQQGQRIFLTFADVQLERCCSCDYITVYDGSSTGYPQLGKVCFNDTTHQVFHSSSRYMTVVFRSDYSGVSHGFKALFTSSLTADQGRVDCSSDNMVIVIQRSYLNSLGLSAYDLYVDDHVCRPSVSSTEVVFSFPLDSCGTVKEMMNGYVSYTNNVRGSQSQSGEITRQSQFLLHVGCRMEPDTMVQIFYKASEVINANITGTGRFNASIAFYSSSSFYYKIYDSPYEVNLNQYLYVQVELNRHDNSLDLFLDTCVASPNPNDFKDRSYDLLRNGCARDNTYYSYTSGHYYYARFRFQAFKFLRTHAYVYLQCKVIICPDNDYNSRCRQGCLSRRKRSLDSSTYHTNTVTLGPIKLKGLSRGEKDLEKSKE